MLHQWKMLTRSEDEKERQTISAYQKLDGPKGIDTKAVD
jgi:hypothetical protein